MKYASRLVGGLVALGGSVAASATSLVDFTDVAITGAATNITDTGTAAAEFVLPIIVGVVALSIGIKLFKRFSGKI